MQFEIYLLEIINEVYFRMKYDYEELVESAKAKLEEKIEKLNNGTYTFSFAEFGCRRRLSREWQDYVVEQFVTRTKNCFGTSNVYLAMKYGVTPIGTFAHEFVQMYQGFPSIPLAYTNHYALKDWLEEYQGDNGIALTDTLTTELFLLDFDLLHASSYKGVRHDSGDPFIWGDQMIDHYKKLGIDSKTKTLLFSDSLNFDKAQKLHDYFKDRVRVSFGIGTFCTNDTKETPLNIVIKLQRINGRPVAKLSDVKGKTMCLDEQYLEYLTRAVEYRIEEEKELKGKY
jgi:nicotinate phosphoribosyltransferase